METEAGASVCVATWPPALNIFLNLLERGRMDEARRMADGSQLTFERIYPLDALFDTLDEAPDEVRESKRYKEVGDFSIDGLARNLAADFGDQPLDILFHSLANGPEVKKSLLETSRAGYLAASSASALPPADERAISHSGLPSTGLVFTMYWPRTGAPQPPLMKLS